MFFFFVNVVEVNDYEEIDSVICHVDLVKYVMLLNSTRFETDN